MKNFFWGAYEKSIKVWTEKCAKQSLVKRLWQKDPTLWKTNPSEQAEIISRLGWLDAVRRMRSHAADLISFADTVRSEALTDVVLLGMGGSSLAPEVFQNVFGNKPGYPKLSVLDSTDPGRVRDVEVSVNLSKSLFIVSSKSGGTVELLSFYKYFFEKIKALFPDAPGGRFVAITDPGSPLESMAKKQHFRRVFLGFPDVGGRFSALTYFGLVPAALIGVDLDKVLSSAESMIRRCSAEVALDQNEAVPLGVGMAILAEAGRDKLTILSPPAFESFGDWAEQLVAESTGKEDMGVIPVVREPAQMPQPYGEDRFFAAFLPAFGNKGSLEAKIETLKKSGHPVLTFCLPEPEDLGGEFFRWEMATAIASSLLKINAFDQPDVQAAKDKTKALLKKIESGQALSAPASNDSLESFWESLKNRDYVSLLAFLPDREPVRKALVRLQAEIRAASRAAVTLGFGPRYLHSTGQLHKGGPDSGIFILFTSESSEDLSIPGEKFSFAQLELAQALGDLEALKSKGRRVFHLRLKDASAPTLERAVDQIKEALHASQTDEVS